VFKLDLVPLCKYGETKVNIHNLDQMQVSLNATMELLTFFRITEREQLSKSELFFL
jgi:hypothetical protein